MVLKNKSDCLTFIVDTIHSIGYETKGASIACHKLAYELALDGNYVYIFNDPLYPHENIEVIPTVKEVMNHELNNFVWEQFMFNLNNTISIYPQTTFGNQFNTINNVMWVLHDFQEKQWSLISDTFHIFNYGSFKVPEGTIQHQLTVFDYNIDKFYNTNNPDRKGFAHIFHKNTPDWAEEFLKIFGSTEIPTYNEKKSIDYLLSEFNKYEYLLTFDDKSFFTTAAALCGTKSIILNPNKELTPIEYRLKNPIQMCGVAYGFDDIKWANNTIELVKENLLQLEQKDKQTVSNFIQYWKKKLL